MTKLNPSETKVLTALLRTGGSNKELAREIGITVATVKVHLRAMFRATGVNTRVKLVLWAQREGRA